MNSILEARASLLPGHLWRDLPLIVVKASSPQPLFLPRMLTSTLVLDNIDAPLLKKSLISNQEKAIFYNNDIEYFGIVSFVETDNTYESPISLTPGFGVAVFKISKRIETMHHLTNTRHKAIVIQGLGRGKVTQHEFIEYAPYQNCFVGKEVSYVPTLSDVDDDIAQRYTKTLVDHLNELIVGKDTYQHNSDFMQLMATLNPVEGLEEILDHLGPLYKFVYPATTWNMLSQRSLTTESLLWRLKDSLALVQAANKVIEVDEHVNEKVNLSLERNNREFYLREKLKAIRTELNEDKSIYADLQQRINSTALSVEARTKTLKELSRLAYMSPNNPESEVSRNYIEKILALPWGKLTALDEKLELDMIETAINSHHYGLDKVKLRIVEFLAVYRRNIILKKNHRVKTPVLCFIGPPGVGKTSIAKSIAMTLGKQLCRVSLGGVSDAHEIRGHRRTYIGATMGTIMDKIAYAKVDNPVFVLDEIDKLGRDNFDSQISGALLELLDPEQNNEFRDLFLDISYDLSQVMFICTANSDDIHPALLDRLEVIYISGYTVNEKVKIAQKHLLPKLRQEMLMSVKSCPISEAVIQHIVLTYTHESGVRELNRLLSLLLRKAITILSKEGEDHEVKITKQNISNYLELPISLPDKIAKQPVVGKVSGLAYISSGIGCILTIEAISMPGEGKVNITGNMGKVMHESATISHIVAKTLVSSLDSRIQGNGLDTYIHLPSANPKDGPSAGTGMCIAMLSSLANRPVKPSCALTGELSLQGEVMRVGGILEKLQAASLHGIKDIYLPKDNESDVALVPKTVIGNMNIVYVTHIKEVVRSILQ